MPEIALTGCTPEPLMSYLKALGVFRLVAEQADTAAKLAWSGGYAVLSSKLSATAIRQFLLEEYSPTPILAPWNGGSGFYGGGDEPLKVIENAKSPRFAGYAAAIRSIRRFLPSSKPKDDDKLALLARCRDELPDDIIPWLDVCFVLGDERVSFFPLLGTGGNDGRLDFTNNFMQRLGEVLPVGSERPECSDSAAWLDASLFGGGLMSLGKAAIGQFNPGGIGGPNGVQGRFEADSRVNSWDYVLMMEGTLLFAGSVARRLGTRSTTRAVFPFSVDSVAVGYGSASANEETTDGSRAELWLPLWERSASHAEVRQLFAEGRAQLGKQQAKNAVEFSLAVSLLGVSRGISGFARYGFLKRNGLAFLAAPLGRVVVCERPRAHLLNDPALVQWLDQLRRACSDKERTPARYQSALRGIDRAVLEFTNLSERSEAGETRALANVLVALGNAERTLAGGESFCSEKYLRPLSGLDAEWVFAADDRSSEFSLASALASVGGRKDTEIGALRSFLEPVAARGAAYEWNRGSTSAVWSNQKLARNLVAVFGRRRIEAFRSGLEGVPLDGIRRAPLRHIARFLRGETNDDRLESLLWALTALNWPAARRFSNESTERATEFIPLEYGALRLLVEPTRLHAREGAWTISNDGPLSICDPTVLDQLRRCDGDVVARAVEQAALRLKSQGKTLVGHRNRQKAGREVFDHSGIDPDRLFGSMLFPLSDLDKSSIANTFLNPPETEE